MIIHSPMDTCREVPKKKYTNTGKNAMYIPCTGGKPPSIPYAMPCGMCMTATVIPDIISDKKSGLIR